MLSKYTKETVRNLTTVGIMFNFVAEIDHKVELFQVFPDEHVRFVAEIDSYGNIVEWGRHLRLSKKEQSLGEDKKVINADGESV